MTPKVFISYSWTSQAHQDRVRKWAERLMADGIDVVLDLYDLKEGDDKNAYMERMVTDPTVTHVLLICDKAYAEKADTRKRGVGTESQIVSKEVYEQVAQSKFIPIVCEVTEDDNPFLPVFLKSRIYLNLSSPELVNENWERLIRLLFGKPIHKKPELGKPPVYVTQDLAPPTSPARTKFSALSQAILQSKKGVGRYRRDFIEACVAYADRLRVRDRPNLADFGEKVFDDCSKLTHVRDHIVDWILLESEAAPSEEFSQAIIDVLERLRELRARPAEVTTWSDAWFEAQKLFVYETFLYVVAALLKTRAFDDLHNIFTSHYINPPTEQTGQDRFKRFDVFYAYSETLNDLLAPKGRRLFSPAAELMKRQAQREDIPFFDLIQADLLILMMAYITPETHWYPQTLHYASHAKEFPFFVRASKHKNFQNLAVIAGIAEVDKLRQAVKEGMKRLEVSKWSNFMMGPDFWQAMNMDKLYTRT
jgi:TIR domain